MANFPIPSAKSRNQTQKRWSPTIDFTPMVDLGFLLITFFMLSTTLAKPTLMAVVMPDAKGAPEPTKASKALTLLLGANDRVFWYEGLETDHLDSTTFDDAGLRQVILNKMDQLQSTFGLQAYNDPKSGTEKQGSYLNVLIKPLPNSTYKNLVDALDEMNICRVRYYCILDPTQTETNLITPKPDVK
ncbi:MAG: biopolymer transporter ExbD [Saprospiraceae bacterium]|jgi:biopolymer transport protein ExbD|nr:biopolymer transporter ExbD [Saprospiraceae bacterium]